MATLDRIDPGYTAWSPSAAGMVTEDDDYVGRHRDPRRRRMALLAVFYAGKHHRRDR